MRADNQVMLKRVGIATIVALVLGVSCFAAWIAAQYGFPFGSVFKPYGDPGGNSDPIRLSVGDVRLYVGIVAVLIAFVLLALVGRRPFSFVGGMWRGAAASVAGPIGYALPLMFAANMGSTIGRIAGASLVVLLGYFFWTLLGVPIFVGVVAGLLSWPFSRLVPGSTRGRSMGSTSDADAKSSPAARA